MNDFDKAQMFDKLVEYMIESAADMNRVGMVLARYPVDTSLVNTLNLRIDKAKVLMSQVFNPQCYLYRYPLLCTLEGKQKYKLSPEPAGKV
jgi:hypothetical protein